MEQYRREVLESQVEIQRQAFERIGTELYDNIGQMLSIAKMNLYVLEESNLDPWQQAYLHQTNEVVGKSIVDLRALIRSLEGCTAQDFDLQDGLRQYFQRIRQAQKAQPELRIQGVPYSLDYDREIVLFRVVKELAELLLKYLHSTDTLTLTLHYTADELSIWLSTSSVSPSEEIDNSPIANIRRRLALIGGKLKIEKNTDTPLHFSINLHAVAPNRPPTSTFTSP
ncbi:MAG: sensor histidine kinase [Runella sp.]